MCSYLLHYCDSWSLLQIISFLNHLYSNNVNSCIVDTSVESRTIPSNSHTLSSLLVSNQFLWLFYPWCDEVVTDIIHATSIVPFSLSSPCLLSFLRWWQLHLSLSSSRVHYRYESYYLYSDVMSVRVKEMDEDMTKPLPHGVDMYKEDLDGPLWWLQDNDYLYRGYRTQLSFWETFKRYLVWFGW